MIYRVVILPHPTRTPIVFHCVADKPFEAVRQVMDELDKPFVNATFELNIYEIKTFVLPKGIIKADWPEEAA